MSNEQLNLAHLIARADCPSFSVIRILQSCSDRQCADRDHGQDARSDERAERPENAETRLIHFPVGVPAAAFHKWMSGHGQPSIPAHLRISISPSMSLNQ